jgi:hypothetical protein
MEETTKKWAASCLVSCFVLVMIAVLLVFGGYLGVKKMIRAAEETQTAMSQVADRFGRTSEYIPPTAGGLPSDRIEVFLEVRELCDTERSTLEESLARLSGSQADEGVPGAGVVRSIQAGLGFLPQMMAYINARNRAFLDADMGLGEYLYLYTIVYMSWMEKPVDDGPPFVLVGGDVRDDPWTEMEVRQRRASEIRHRLGRLTLPMLRNQLAALPEEAAADGNWAESLRTEILLMERDPMRVPWQDGLPPQTAASLEPHYDRLAASYSALVHPVELAVMQH